MSLLELSTAGLPEARADRAAAEKKVQEWLRSDFAGFRRILDKDSAEAPDLKAITQAAEKHSKGSTGKAIRNFVVLGTGGSSLGAETVIRALYPAHGDVRFFFLDNNDPAYFAEHLQLWKPEETLIYAVSKSGGTPETVSQLLVVIGWLKQKLPQGEKNWRSHVVLCTDPKKSDFLALAKKENLTCLEVPSAVGGRYSVLTAVGLFPAAFAGLSLEGFLTGARECAIAWEKKPEANPAFQLAAQLVAGAPKRNITVLMPYSTQLSAFSRWFCQLWAESLGKDGLGLTPYPAVGTTDQHSQIQLYMEGPADKVIGFLVVRKPAEALPLPMLANAEDLPAFALLKGHSMRDLFHAEYHATRDALTEQKVPNFALELPALNEKTLGALFYFWELCTAYAGALLGVNPFDQPGVEKAKILTKRYLADSRK